MDESPPDEYVFTTNRGRTIRIRAVYAKENPPGLWEAVVKLLASFGLFDPPAEEELARYKAKRNTRESIEEGYNKPSEPRRGKARNSSRK